MRISSVTTKMQGTSKACEEWQKDPCTYISHSHIGNQGHVSKKSWIQIINLLAFGAI